MLRNSSESGARIRACLQVDGTFQCTHERSDKLTEQHGDHHIEEHESNYEAEEDEIATNKRRRVVDGPFCARFHDVGRDDRRPAVAGGHCDDETC